MDQQGRMNGQEESLFVSYIFPDFKAVEFLKRDFDGLVEKGLGRYGKIQVVGYEIYLVEQWILERKIGSIITSFTGNNQHCVEAVKLTVYKSDHVWPMKLKKYLNELVKSQHAKLKAFRDEGYLFVTNLSSFYSDTNLNIRQITAPYIEHGEIPVPTNYLQFETNFNLKRLDCGGRSALLFSNPPKASEDKFFSMYKVNESIPIAYAVKDLVMIVQIALYYFDTINPTYCDGILCNKTQAAIEKWWDTVGRSFFGQVPQDGILGPKTVAAVLSVLVSCKLRLNLITSDSSKDPFDIITFKLSVYHFQKNTFKMKDPSWLLDPPTLAKLVSITDDKLAYGNMIKFKKAVNRTVNDISRRSNRINDVSIETTNIEELKLNVYGKRLEYLFLGKGRPTKLTNVLLDIYYSQKKFVNKPETRFFEHLGSDIHQGAAVFVDPRSPEMKPRNKPASTVGGSAANYMSAFKSVATQKKQKINDSLNYVSKPAINFISNQKLSEDDSPDSTTVSNPDISSLSHSHSRSRNLSQVLPHHTPRRLDDDAMVSNNPLKSGVGRIKNLHSRTRPIPLKILANEDEDDRTIDNTDYVSININMSPNPSTPLSPTAFQRNVLSESDCESIIYRDNSFVNSNASMEAMLDRNSTEAMLDRTSTNRHEDGFEKSFTQCLNRRMSFPYTSGDLNIKMLSYDYVSIDAMTDPAAAPLVRSKSVSNVEPLVGLLSYMVDKQPETLARDYVQAKIECLRTMKKFAVWCGKKPLVHNGAHTDSLETKSRRASGTSLLSMGSSINSLSVGTKTRDFTQLYAYLQQSQASFIRKLEYLTKNLTTVFQFRKVYNSRLSEVETLISKLKYEVRILKIRVRDVDESTNELNTKIDALKRSGVVHVSESSN